SVRPAPTYSARGSAARAGYRLFAGPTPGRLRLALAVASDANRGEVAPPTLVRCGLPAFCRRPDLGAIAFGFWAGSAQVHDQVAVQRGDQVGLGDHAHQPALLQHRQAMQALTG